MPEKDSRTDEVLIAAVNRGDWSAFDVLYYRYRDWTYRLAWRFCGVEADAQDVVQEVFLYLARKFPGLTLTAGLTTLLYPAVKHTALAIKRKRRAGQLSDEIEIPAVPEAPAGEQVRRELAVVLRRLSEAHREVLLMRFVDDMTLEEIAVALAIPAGTVKSRLHHALTDLREDTRLRKYFESG